MKAKYNKKVQGHRFIGKLKYMSKENLDKDRIGDGIRALFKVRNIENTNKY